MEYGILSTNKNTLNRTENKDLRKAFANVIQKLRISSVKTHVMAAFLVCCLIQLDRNPGLRSIVTREVLLRITRKVMVFPLMGAIRCKGTPQVCVAHE